MAKGVFVTATGTDAGKTFVAALLVKKLKRSGRRAGYYKAALSGAEPSANGLVPGDAEFVKKAAGLPPEEAVVSFVYREAVSPHLAARNEGTPPSLPVILRDYGRLSRRCGWVTVEGSGGVVCPLRFDGTETLMLTDVVAALGLPSLVVAGSGLGTINATVLTLDYMARRNLPVAGVVLNRFRTGCALHEDNRRTIEAVSGVPVIACVAENETEFPLTAGELTLLYGGDENDA